ncbi:MAG: gliding motility-associated C-terminal domain-containing protein [Phaeodactylibacter sp.]|uniref:T9SS type B sorting domain-containing protein n=1 Tax=Phaeodactylibacter sp. TaxID=1940289 RepID=UPI0032EAFBC7
MAQRLHFFWIGLLMAFTVPLHAQFDCCAATPLAGSGPINVPTVAGPGNDNDNLANGTCLVGGEHDTYYFVFEATSSGTFEMLVTPNNLNADYDFALIANACPGSPGAQQISCNYVGPINTPPFVPTGIATNPVASWGINGAAEWENTVNLTAGTTYLLILDNITGNDVGFTIETGGTATIAPGDVGGGPPPTIFPAGPFCPEDPPFQLTANPPGGTWGGSATNTGLFVPANNGTGTHEVTYSTPGAICPNETMLDIEVLSGPTIIINSGQPLCPDSPPTTLTATPPGGTWGGVATPSGLVNPQALGQGSFQVTYTVTGPNGCEGTETGFVTILPPPTVSFSTPGPFCLDEGVVTLQALPFGGTWSGVASANGQIITGALGPGPHTATYSFTNNNGCTTTEDLVFEIVPNPVVAIVEPGPFCQDDLPVVLEALPPGGTWGGAVSANGLFDPQQAGPGFHLVTYTFTDVNFCTSTDDFLIEVAAPPFTYIDAPQGPFCSSSPPVPLTGVPGGGVWGGEAAPNGTFNPAGRTNGTYTVTYTYTDPNGCEATAAFDLEISSDLQVSIQDPGPYCEGAVPDTLSGSPTGGSWSGDVDAQGVFDPSVLPPGNYTAVYDYTDPEGCEGTDTLDLEILPLPMVAIDSVGVLCEDAAPVNLTATPAGGVWSGDAAAMGTFNASANGPGTYQAIYTFENAAGCSDADTVAITIVPLPAPMISNAGPFCANDTLQTLSAMPQGGVWSGAADAQGGFDPAGLGSGIYDVIYTLTSDEGCTAADTLSIEALELPTGSISGNGDICQGSSDTVQLSLDFTGQPPFTYTIAIDGNPQPALNSSDLSAFFAATLPGNYTLLELTDANGCTISGTGSATVNLNTAPTVSGIMTTCDSTNTSYTLSFLISGGDSTSYQLQFSDGSTVDNAPGNYTTPPLPNGSAYNITVTDANDCNPTVVSGTFSCDCATAAGSMGSGLTTVCEDDTATLVFNQDALLDPNDTLLFVLHDNNGTSLGSILAENDTPVFGFQPGMNYGQTYYVSAVATDVTAAGAPDYSSPCLSVSIGAPVAFYALPTGTLLGDTAICEGSTAILTFGLTGTAPFDFTYEANGIADTIENVNTPYTLPGMPGAATTYVLTGLSDSSPASCSNVLADSATVDLNVPTSSNQALEICQGDSLLIGGAFQTEPGTYVDTLTGANNCDSLIFSTLVVNIPDTTLLSGTSCDPAQTGTFTEVLTNAEGCDSVIMTTVTLLQSDTVQVQLESCNPADAGTTEELLVNQDGCDSLVITITSLLPVDTTVVEISSCDPAEVGTTEDLLLNQFGCDSLVVTTTVFLESDTTLLDATTCNPAEAGTTAELLSNQDGCDSLVITTTTLLPSDTTFLDATSCNPAETGVTEDLLMNQFGCDSLVITTTTMLPSDTTMLSTTSCDPAEVGTAAELLTNQFGCDSLVLTTTTLLPSDTTQLNATTCDPAEAGTTEAILTNQFGCDSLIITTTTLLPSDTTIVEAGSCNPAETGTEETVLTNQFGCDSLIVTITSLLPSDTTLIAQSSCDPAQVGTTETLLANQFGCDSLIVTITSLLPSDTIMLSNTSCDPADVGTTAELLTNQFGCDSLVITTTTLLPVDTTLLSASSCLPEEVGTVTEVLVNQFGCDSLVITTTTLAPLEIAAAITSTYGPYEVSCAGGDDGMATVEILSGDFQPPFTYAWSNGAASAAVDNLGAGTHSVTVTSANGCSAVDSITLTAPEALLINLNISPISCFGEADGAVQVVAEGGTPPYVYAIDDGAFQSNSTFTGLNEGSYTVAVQDVNGCIESAAILINQPLELEVSLGEDISIEVGADAILQIQTNLEPEDIDTIIWEPRFPTECPDCLEQVVTPLVTTAYSVMVVDLNGCTAGDQVNVLVDQRQSVYLPNVFSPNDDGTNDVFYVQGDDRVEQVDVFQVYNRWGEIVFEAYNFQVNDSQFGWDGTFRGDLMNGGVFVYYVVATFKNGTTAEFKGDVILMR